MCILVDMQPLPFSHQLVFFTSSNTLYIPSSNEFTFTLHDQKVFHCRRLLNFFPNFSRNWNNRSLTYNYIIKRCSLIRNSLVNLTVYVYKNHSWCSVLRFAKYFSRKKIFWRELIRNGDIMCKSEGRCQRI